jgi:hypothetical protein
MNATVLHGTEVAEFATAVRAALSDLPPDELDELTDGLEADLSERLDESPDASAGLGDPLAYAEELRAAAGYPPRTARSHLGSALPNLRTLPQQVRDGWASLLERHQWLASVAGFFTAIRPVWWVFRGAALYALLASFLGINGFSFWPLGVAMVVLSVQLGRGRMLSRAWVRWATRAGSVIAIIAAPFILGWLLNAWSNAMYPSDEGFSAPQGLTHNGRPIDNVFAYDAAGDPIDQVQLFDQDGNPLDLVGDTTADFWGTTSGGMVVPSDDVAGRAGWNVFPLDHANSWSDYEDDGMLDESEIAPTRFPVGQVEPLSGYEAAADAADHGEPMSPVDVPAG